MTAAATASHTVTMKSSTRRPSRIHNNPFIHVLKFTTAQKVQICLMSVTVFPVRFMLVCFFLLLAWPFTFAASFGRSEYVVEPQTWWRRIVDVCIRVIMRTMWFCGGFHWVKIKGQRADPSEAPILTVAPHSSFFDSIACTNTMCSTVSKLDIRHIPICGTVMSYIRPVFVSRSDPDSRRKTVEEIKRRVTSGAQWPQLMIFPEGLCTNRSGLLLFKSGAFIPGLPIQPVVLRYPNQLDTVSWAWKGPGPLKILWLTLCQVHNSMEIEYLPVYTPSEEERENPALFADNVRKLMAKALDVPLIDLSFDDRDVCLSKGPLGIFNFSSLLEFNQLVCRLGQKATLNSSKMEEEATKACKMQGERLSVESFAQRLGLPVRDTLTQVHSMFDQNEDGNIDYRHYVIALLTVCRPTKPKENLKLAFKMYETQEDGNVIEDDLATILEITLGVEDMCLSGLFLSLEEDTGKITYDEFCQFIDQHPYFVSDYIRFKDHPRTLCFRRAKSSNGSEQKKTD